MTEARAEVVLKFSKLPVANDIGNKKVEVQLTDQNGIVFTAHINSKSWRKAEANVAAFEEWGGAISGKLGRNGDRFEVIDAGVTIFEKKAKPPKEESVA